MQIVHCFNSRKHKIFNKTQLQIYFTSKLSESNFKMIFFWFAVAFASSFVFTHTLSWICYSIFWFSEVSFSIDLLLPLTIRWVCDCVSRIWWECMREDGHFAIYRIVLCSNNTKKKKKLTPPTPMKRKSPDCDENQSYQPRRIFNLSNSSCFYSFWYYFANNNKIYRNQSTKKLNFKYFNK